MINDGAGAAGDKLRYDGIYAWPRRRGPLVCWVQVWASQADDSIKVLVIDLYGLDEDLNIGGSVTNRYEDLAEHVAAALLAPPPASVRWFVYYAFSGGRILECTFTPPGSFEGLSWRGASLAGLANDAGRPVGQLPDAVELKAIALAAGATIVGVEPEPGFVARRVASLPVTQRMFKCAHFQRWENRGRAGRLLARWTGNRWLRSRHRRRDEDCAWYHAGDWRRVAEASLQLLAELGQQPEREAMLRMVAALARDDWEQEALFSLFAYPIVLAGADDYVNGQTRSCALRYAGAKTVVIGL